MSDIQVPTPMTPTQDGIDFGMKNYQNCKAIAKPYNGPDDTIAAQREYILDMTYWEQYLMAAGGVSIEQAQMGPRYMSSEEAWEDQMTSARKECTLMAANGSPLMGYVGTIPS